MIDPLQFLKLGWPGVKLSPKQRDILYSLRDDDETVVPAGNMMGKDFVAGYAVLWFFLSRQPCRIVTTSAKDDHLRVLWSEINRFVATCRFKLRVEDDPVNGVLRVNHHDIRRFIRGRRDEISYLTGMVANPNSIASMQGHHVPDEGDGIPRTLFVSDESSSVPDEYYTMARTWARRFLIIGNPWPCENFFRRAVREGDRYSTNRKRCYRRIIPISARFSPNVQHEVARIKAGLREPLELLIRSEDRPWGEYSADEYRTLRTAWDASGREDPGDQMLLPGVKPFSEYVKNRELWDEWQQKVSLDGEFHEGADVKLYPREWLDRANRIGDSLPRVRKATAIGVDPAEGGDETTMVAVDEQGVIDVFNRKTPDTTRVIDYVLDFMAQYDVPPSRVAFDRGGGGKEHADRMRRMGYPVVTVGFGESAGPERRALGIQTKRDDKEKNYAYVNRRAQMYGLLRLRLDPSSDRFFDGFGIPTRFSELRRQLEPIPLDYDEEGRLQLLPKSRSYMETNTEGTSSKRGLTLYDLIGRSPDHADALVLAVYVLDGLPKPRVIGGPIR